MSELKYMGTHKVVFERRPRAVYPRLVIPLEAVQALGMRAGDAVEIYLDLANRQIVLKPVAGADAEAYRVLREILGEMEKKEVRE